MQEFVNVSIVLKYILVVMLSKLCTFFFFLSVLSVFFFLCIFLSGKQYRYDTKVEGISGCSVKGLLRKLE